VAQKLLTAMTRPLKIGGKEYHLSGSIGIAVYPKDGTDSSSLLKNADIAMYRAKASGETLPVLSNEIDVHSVDRLSLENELRQRVARREIEVHYQPKIDIQTGRIAGAEALVRWRHPQRGMLQPGDFIFVAEEAGLISSIGCCVLETVCADYRAMARCAAAAHTGGHQSVRATVCRFAAAWTPESGATRDRLRSATARIRNYRKCRNDRSREGAAPARADKELRYHAPQSMTSGPDILRWPTSSAFRSTA